MGTPSRFPAMKIIFRELCHPAALTLALFIFLVLLATSCDRPQPQSASAQASIRFVPLTNMVPIKAGSFIRGNHTVKLTHDFWIGKYEVTQRAYLAITLTNPSHFTNDLD